MNRISENCIKVLAILAIFGLLSSVVMATAPLSKTGAETREQSRGSQNQLEMKMTGDFVPEEILVKYKNQKHHELVKVRRGEEKEKIKEYSERTDIDYAEPNYIVQIAVIPNDPQISWGLHNVGQSGGTPDADIDGPEAWDITTGSSNGVVAAVDTGTDYNHPDLKNNIWINPGEIGIDAAGHDKRSNQIDDDPNGGNGYIDDWRGWDFFNNDNDPMDDHGHGTHVAGIISAVGNNGIGTAGVSWNSKIMILKFMGSSGGGTIDAAVKAIDYATANGVPTSNSWGCEGCYSQTLQDAISRANDAGLPFVAAAGNNGKDSQFYPASYALPNVIAVAATNQYDYLTSWSNFGPWVHIAAPGDYIYGPVPNGTCALCNPQGYTYLSGTSMAAPHVAGVVRLLKDVNPEMNGSEIKKRILAGVDVIPSLQGKTLTGGRLNAFKVLETDDTTPPATITDLSATNPTINSISLSWTATGDDGIINGPANIYELGYSVNPITESNWDSVPKATGLPKPNTAGSQENFVLKELSANTTYYLAIKAVDNAGNPSGISNVVFATTKVTKTIFENKGETDLAAEGLWHKETNNFFSPVTSWAYNTGYPSYTYNTGSRNSGNLSLPKLNLSGYITPVMEFKSWYQTEAGSGVTYDKRFVTVSSGSLVKTIQFSGEPMFAWSKKTIDLSEFEGMDNVQVKIYFDSMDNILNDFQGWYIDDIIVYGELKPENNPPTAVSQKVATKKNIAARIVLAGTDPDGDALTYRIASQPQYGTLVPYLNFATNGKVTYYPPKGFTGNTAFTFVVNDGKTDSAPATVYVEVKRR